MRNILMMILLLSLTGLMAQDQPVSRVLDLFEKQVDRQFSVSLKEIRVQAYQAYEKGDYEASAAGYLTLLQYNIEDENSLYNLSCCYGLMGNDVLAAKYLDRAYRAGFNDLDHIRRDPDFEKVRTSAVFNAQVDSLSRLAMKSPVAGEVVYLSGTDLRTCRICLPQDYDPRRKYTLLVALHGYGDTGDGFSRVWSKFDRRDFILAVPEAPYAFMTGSEMGYSWTLTDSVDAATWKDCVRRSESYVLDVIREMKERYKVSDTYLLGFSQGCTMSLVFGIRNAGMIKGVIGFGGWLEEDLLDRQALKSGKKLRVFLAHGREDRIVEFTSSEKTRSILSEYGYPVEFSPFEGSHTVDAASLKQAELWMSR